MVEVVGVVTSVPLLRPVVKLSTGPIYLSTAHASCDNCHSLPQYINLPGFHFLSPNITLWTWKQKNISNLSKGPTVLKCVWGLELRLVCRWNEKESHCDVSETRRGIKNVPEEGTNSLSSWNGSRVWVVKVFEDWGCGKKTRMTEDGTWTLMKIFSFMRVLCIYRTLLAAQKE